jgi:hypothetical protein
MASLGRHTAGRRRGAFDGRMPRVEALDGRRVARPFGSCHLPSRQSDEESVAMVKAMARDGEATLLNSLGQRLRRTVVLHSRSTRQVPGRDAALMRVWRRLASVAAASAHRRPMPSRYGLQPSVQGLTRTAAHRGRRTSRTDHAHRVPRRHLSAQRQARRERPRKKRAASCGSPSVAVAHGHDRAWRHYCGATRAVCEFHMASFRVATRSEDSHHPASSARRDRHRLPAAGGLQHNEAPAALNRNT